ncbi:MAG: VCBS repeat-containing protein, partial [Planctomycetaceae bacterium]|nr:VCBS repeat-containing protein [Planctomycetaceae bacterium]
MLCVCASNGCRPSADSPFGNGSAPGATVETETVAETRDRAPETTPGSTAANASEEAAAAGQAGRPPFQFTEITEEVGIQFEHFSGDNPDRPFPAANGSGIGAIDFDMDGRIDLWFVNGASFPDTAADRYCPGDRLYRNVPGQQFADVTDSAVPRLNGYGAGCAVSDVDGDGFPDVYINGYGPNRLYLNNGDGTFRENTAEAGVEDSGWGTSVLFTDFDADGDPDLYVCNYAEWTWATNQFCGNRERNIRIFCSPRSVVPVRDSFFENLGDGTFRNVLAAVGLDREPGRGQGVVAADLDADGRTDLYVANDASPNFLFRNRGDGT